MVRALLLAVVLPVPAFAADRAIAVGSFDRVRIDGPFAVRIVTRRSPRATLSADPRTLDLVELRVDGTTLILKRRGGVATAAAPVSVALDTPSLRAASVVGSAEVTVTGMTIDRADLAVAGTGQITVDGLAVEQASAAVIGGGRITLAGRAGHLRLSGNGSGSIDASRLDADEVAIRLEGPGEMLARARYTASVASSGGGRVMVTGKPKCAVRAPAGSTVTCGAP